MGEARPSYAFFPAVLRRRGGGWLLKGGRHTIECAGRYGLRKPLKAMAPNSAAERAELEDIRLSHLFGEVGVAPRVFSYGLDRQGPATLIEMYPCSWSELQGVLTGATDSVVVAGFALRVARALVRAVAQVADLGYVLLDLKPLNVVFRLGRTGGLRFRALRLIDFEKDFTSYIWEHGSSDLETHRLLGHAIMLALLLLHFEKYRERNQNASEGTWQQDLFLEHCARHLRRELKTFALPLEALRRSDLAGSSLFYKLTRVLGCYGFLGIAKERAARDVRAGHRRCLRYLGQQGVQDGPVAVQGQALDPSRSVCGAARTLSHARALSASSESLDIQVIKSLPLPEELSAGKPYLAYA